VRVLLCLLGCGQAATQECITVGDVVKAGCRKVER
jgi:hypothetical protein